MTLKKLDNNLFLKLALRHLIIILYINPLQKKLEIGLQEHFFPNLGFVSKSLIGIKRCTNEIEETNGKICSEISGTASHNIDLRPKVFTETTRLRGG